MAEKLKIIPLGGLDEIGKNITVLEYGKDMIVIDCGVGFPDEDMYGVDLVIPDFSYLVQNAKKLRGMFITHGHEDHIGSIPYCMQQVICPIHGTAMTNGLIKLKLEEHRLADKVKLITHKPGDVVKAGCFTVEFIHVNHSIADAVAFAIHTPVGTVVIRRFSVYTLQAQLFQSQQSRPTLPSPSIQGSPPVGDNHPHAASGRHG